jgi:tetrahydrodipicolinate N-succinyltransferase
VGGCGSVDGVAGGGWVGVGSNVKVGLGTGVSVGSGVCVGMGVFVGAGVAVGIACAVKLHPDRLIMSKPIKKQPALRQILEYIKRL